MKRTVLVLCMVMALAAAANAACYKCITSGGMVSFTDSPPRDAACEWLSNCSSTYSDELERENAARDAISRRQWEEAEARKSALKRQELEARNLELKEKELELRQRELDASADRAWKENATGTYDAVWHPAKPVKGKPAGGYPPPLKPELRDNEPDPKVRNDGRPKNDAAGHDASQGVPKTANDKSAVKVQQMPSVQPYFPEKN